MRKENQTKINRSSAALTTSVVAGVLVFAIMADNGGTQNSQRKWDYVSTSALSIDAVPVESRFAGAEDEELAWVDPVVTGSINVKKDIDAEPLSVMALIRKNSDVNPGTSSGTDRVSITVKPGDTLFGLSRKYGLSVAELAIMNGLTEPYTIQVDQRLYVAR